MTERKPNRFVGLHNHTHFSPYDGLGYPDEHINWCIENGLDGYAITEHGNFNSYAHAQLYVEKLNASGKNFKYIPGVEAYFHPDLAQWKRDKELAEEAATNKKAAAKLQKEQEKLQTKIVAKIDESDEIEEIEMTNALTIENEEETKSNKFFNPVNRRHHLVLLPKNQAGLLSLFAASSKAYIEGFYRFPRMDLRMLREAAKDGNVIASSACIHPDSMLHTNYGLLSIKEVVERLNDGSELFVLSYDVELKKASFQKISWGGITRRDAKLLQLKLKNGKILKLTPDHNVYTKKGWKEAKDLIKSDVILAIHQ